LSTASACASQTSMSISRYSIVPSFPVFEEDSSRPPQRALVDLLDAAGRDQPDQPQQNHGSYKRDQHADDEASALHAK
jgi:hypothetical protein